MLITRRTDWSATPIIYATVLVLGVIAVLASRRMRRNWFTRKDGLVRLEATLGLNNRLSCAAAGVGQWPEPRPIAKSGLRWRWGRLAGPLALGLSFLAAANWLPIAPQKPAERVKIEPPLAWSQVETALEELKRNEVAEPDAIAAMEQKLEALRQQSPETWYSQSSLEAGAALKDETGNAIAALERNLNAASTALPQVGQVAGSAAPITPEKEAMWNEALKGLQSGGLPLNKADISALKECTNGNSQLSPEQIKSLQKNLAKQGVVCKSALGKVGDALASSKLEGLEGEQDQAPGPGGGGKTAPLGMRQTPTALQPTQEQPLAGKDMENAALGDVLKVTVGAHKVDPSESPNAPQGGGVASVGAGGDAVWKIAPSPKEQSVLKEYFK